MKNRDFRPISRFISMMVQNRAIVNMEYEYETVPKLSNGTISNTFVTLSNLAKYSVTQSLARSRLIVEAWCHTHFTAVSQDRPCTA